MEHDELLALMRYTQERLREHGMDELVDRLSEELAERDEPVATRMLRILEMIETEMRPHASQTTARMLEHFQTVARTEDGKPPRGLRLDLAPAHRELFDRDSIALRGSPRVDRLLNDLAEMHAEMRSELERDNPNPA
jgi:hypothetical protein